MWRFQDTPDTYYEALPARLPGHGEDAARLAQNRILIDGAPARDEILLQIFTRTVIGPIFFEIIQRKGAQALAKATSARCSSPSNSTRYDAACFRIRANRLKTPRSPKPGG
jgi:hypothetical protein